MPPFLTAFFDRYPAIDLRLFTNQALGQDQTAAYDMQIQYLQPLEVHNVAIRVATLHFMFYASQTYLARFGAPECVEDLRAHRLGDITSILAGRGSMAAWTSVSADPVFLSNSNMLVGELTRAGGVMALLPTFTSALHAELHPVLPELHYTAPVFLCFERAAGAKPAVRAVIDYLKRHVFDAKRMPWFAERFALPHKNWRGMLDDCVSRAGRAR
jgi:DNA-binding transcriptional LysR family regulator